MKHQYTYTLFFNVNKTVFEFFIVSHLTEEMVKHYTHHLLQTVNLLSNFLLRILDYG